MAELAQKIADLQAQIKPIESNLERLCKKCYDTTESIEKALKILGDKKVDTIQIFYLYRAKRALNDV